MTEETKKELVDHPAHYTKGKYEHEKVVVNWGMGYHLARATAHMMRAPYKENEELDLNKARWYLNRTVEEPEIAVIKFPLRTVEPTVYTIEEVATDWFGSEIRDPLRKVLFHIGTAVLHHPSFDWEPDMVTAYKAAYNDVREQLTAARTILDLHIRNKKAEIDAQEK